MLPSGSFLVSERIAHHQTMLTIFLNETFDENIWKPPIQAL